MMSVADHPRVAGRSSAGRRPIIRGSPADHPRINRPAYHRRMDQDRLEAARAALHDERARTFDELVDTDVVAPEPMTYGSQAASASQVFAQQRDLALRDASERRLHEVDAALARIEAGTYGRCRVCGGQIAGARLEALPWAPLCIECQRTAGQAR
jgi:DnaK suppressor protein